MGDLDDPALLGKEVGVLVQRLRVWTPARWSAGQPPWGTRADLGRHLAQWFADRAAELEGAPARALPVLAPDLLVADQLAVTGDDLLRAGPGPDLVHEAVVHLLLHRFELLDEEPPGSLGGPGSLRAGRDVCAER